MPDSFTKKENIKKKIKKKKDKELKREDRKTNNNKGKSLEDMFVYVDKNGQLTSTPPVQKQPETKNEKRSDAFNKKYK